MFHCMCNVPLYCDTLRSLVYAKKKKKCRWRKWQERKNQNEKKKAQIY